MKRSDLSHHVRNTLKRLPHPFDNHYGVRPSPPPFDTPSILMVQKRHSAAIEALTKIETIVSEMADSWLVSRILLRMEAVSSSAIEGTNSTLDELLLAEEDSESEARSHDALQAKNYAMGLESILPLAKEHGYNVFNIDLIKDLHRAVMKDNQNYKDIPGNLRNSVVWIGGLGNIAYSTFNPPPPEDVPLCLQENINFMRDDGYETVPSTILTRMAIAHAHFEAVHPFKDGNGRIGRLLLPLMMASAGHIPLYLSPYIEANKSSYYSSLKAAQQKLDWSEMIGFISDAVVGTVNELLLTRKALAELKDDWMTRRQFRARSTSLRATSLLLDYPIITIGRLATKLNVTFPQASLAIQQLCDIGILKEKTGYRRNRLFVATEVISLINRPFNVEPAQKEKPTGMKP
jgi:Fic family protein